MMNAEERQAVRAALEALERDGRLTPESVVEVARSESHPLHSYFTWDDSVAAHKYRVDQARVLIRTVKVQLIVEERNVRVVRYVRDPEAEADQQGYVSVERLRTDSEGATRRALCRYELDRAAALLARTETLIEVLTSDDDPEEGPRMRRELQRLRGRVESLAERLGGEATP